MATTQEVLELVVKVQGEAEGKKLEAMLATHQQRSADLAAKVDRLNDVHQHGAVEAEKYAASMARVTKQIEANNAAQQRQIQRFETSAIKAGNATSKVAGVGQALLQAGRGIQDFQAAGIRGVLNNVEGLTQAIGGSAGLAGALTVLAVGFEVFKPKIMEFIASLDKSAVTEFTSQLDKLAKEIKDLEGKEVKVATDISNLAIARDLLEDINRAIKESEALRRSQSTVEKESAAAVTKALEEAAGGGAKVREDLRAAITPEVQAREVQQTVRDEATARAKLAQARKDVLEAAKSGQPEMVDVAAAEIDKLMEKLDQLHEKRLKIIADIRKPGTGAIDIALGKLLDEAKTGGVDQEAGVGRLAAQLGRAGRGDVAAQVRRVSPARLRQKAATKEAAEMEAQEELFEKEHAEALAKKADNARKKADAAREKSQQERAGRIREQMPRFLAGVDQPDIVGPAGRGPGPMGPARPRGLTREKGLAAMENEREERMASFIMRQSGGDFSKPQAMEAAQAAQKTLDAMGQMGQTQEAVNAAIRDAMLSQYESMRQMIMRMMQQQGGFRQMGDQFQQMAQPLQENQQGFLNWGGR